MSTPRRAARFAAAMVATVDSRPTPPISVRSRGTLRAHGLDDGIRLGVVEERRLAVRPEHDEPRQPRLHPARDVAGKAPMIDRLVSERGWNRRKHAFEIHGKTLPRVDCLPRCADRDRPADAHVLARPRQLELRTHEQHVAGGDAHAREVR